MSKRETMELEDGKRIDVFDYPKDQLPSFGSFRPADWYWQIKGDAGFVWSSDRAARVPIDDLAFKTWVAEGRGRVTYIASIEEMRQVWSSYGLVQDAGAQYRAIRADRYVKELGKQAEGEQASFEKTMGDVLDAVIAQVAGLTAVTGNSSLPEFAELLGKIQRIKAEVPKPAAAAAREVKDGK